MACPLARSSRVELSERIQKMLANAGAGSRRQIERWIEAGQVVVNGRPAQLGDRLEGNERVSIRGKLFRWPSRAAVHRHEHLLYYKPVGEVTARVGGGGGKSVFEKLPKPHRGRWISVGRLDINTSGLLLFTTDGELAHRLMHPSYEITREYAVRLHGRLSEEQINSLERGVLLEDGPARFDKIKSGRGAGSNVWYDVCLHEGRNREVRRLFEALGLTVSRLIRVRYGSIRLGNLRRGQSRFLTRTEAKSLYRAVGLSPEEA